MIAKRRILVVAAGALLLLGSTLAARAPLARGSEPVFEDALFEASISIPGLAAADKEAVQNALADESITRVDVRPDIRDAVLFYPSTADPPGAPAEKALGRLKALGDKFAKASFLGVTTTLSTETGTLQGFVMRGIGTADDPKLVFYNLYVLLKPAKNHVWGAPDAPVKVAIDVPEGVKLSKILPEATWSIEGTTITDPEGAPSKTRSYGVRIAFPAGGAEKPHKFVATVRFVDVVTNTARVVKLVVPFDKRWFRD